MLLWCDGISRTPFPTLVVWAAFDEKAAKPGPVNLPAAPLMHGTGAFNAMWNMALAGSVCTMPSRSFDPKELLDTVQQHKVNSMSIVGDAFAKPILKALDENPGKWDISSLSVIISSCLLYPYAVAYDLSRVVSCVQQLR